MSSPVVLGTYFISNEDGVSPMRTCLHFVELGQGSPAYAVSTFRSAKARVKPAGMATLPIGEGAPTGADPRVPFECSRK